MSDGKLYSYVVKIDSGFAPNPFWGYCTLACCKPKIRALGGAGDWIIGTGASGNVGHNKLIYAMKVTEKLTFDAYYIRFPKKRPSRGILKMRGDNIYYKDALKRFDVLPVHHTEEHRKRDLDGACVLVSDYFFYFGRNAVTLPSQYHTLIKSGSGHKSRFTEDVIAAFTTWLTSTFTTGVNGLPYLLDFMGADA